MTTKDMIRQATEKGWRNISIEIITHTLAGNIFAYSKVLTAQHPRLTQETQPITLRVEELYPPARLEHLCLSAFRQHLLLTVTLPHDEPNVRYQLPINGYIPDAEEVYQALSNQTVNTRVVINTSPT